jgi:myo-inositol-1(or 4)-monophosphatase
MDTDSLRCYVDLACEAARGGGDVLRRYRRRFTVREKGRFDLVTEADLAAQEAIQRLLLEHYPDHAFLGEEQTAGSITEAVCDRPTWIVDPLDGTTNYVHDVPIYAVSIGLAVDGELRVGVIYDPTRDELFHAAEGLGAWVGSERLQVSTAARLEEALLSTGFPPDMVGQERSLRAWHHLSMRTRSLRRTGSTALNLAYVAAGRNDGFWTYQAFPWDAAAGIVLIHEAGGRVSRPDGRPYTLDQIEVLATNGPLHPVLLEQLRE